MNLDEFAQEYRRLSEQLDAGLRELREQGRTFAQAERAYRHAKARAWLQAPRGTVPEREAWVNGETAEMREKRDVADGLRQAALESVRSRRGQMSALQTRLNAHQEEAKFARTGPEVAA